MDVNAGVPKGSVLSATLFLLHINDLLNPNLFGYADDSTVTERYLSSPRASANDILEQRESLVERINLTLKEVSDLGDANFVKFYAAKTQACLFSAKKSPFTLAPTFRVYPFQLATILSSCVNISSNLNFDKCIESKAKVAAKNLVSLIKLGGTSRQVNASHSTRLKCEQAWSTYCSHLWGGSAKYQLEA
ncbi:jg11901 [Pararge aegeria aegeria]|uniref:Jg11901 protein n=1 Tax=Pararge aegeria aegeria TaxID=348720 RepID=A0A8S4RZY6_9NEOP|nr:jg11901 [Pararge aegeria aegeria]